MRGGAGNDVVLKPIQFAILCCLTKGLTYKQIGKEVGCSAPMVGYWVMRARITNGCRTCDQLMYQFGYWRGKENDHERQTV